MEESFPTLKRTEMIMLAGIWVFVFFFSVFLFFFSLSKVDKNLNLLGSCQSSVKEKLRENKWISISNFLCRMTSSAMVPKKPFFIFLTKIQTSHTETICIINMQTNLCNLLKSSSHKLSSLVTSGNSGHILLTALFISCTKASNYKLHRCRTNDEKHAQVWKSRYQMTAMGFHFSTLGGRT